MSCESYLTENGVAIVLNCNRHGEIRTFETLWEESTSIEHIYAVWLKHLGEQ